MAGVGGGGLTGKAARDAILRRVDANWEEQLHVTREAVRIQSVTGHEGPMQAYMADLYGRLGLRVDRFVPDRARIENHEAFVDSGVPFGPDRPNVIGVLPGRPDAPSLTLHGHVDVVSPEPVDAWTRDPWGAEVEGNRLYGRGAGDMKAGLIANAFALKALLDAGVRPRGEVQLHSVIEEEAGGGGGALACLLHGYRTDGFITTEPHALRITISHGGILYFRVRVVGRTAHAGWAHLGVNAIGKMAPIYHALIALDERRGREIRFPLYERGSGRSCHLNVGTLRAGDWPSTVAGFAVLEGRMGFVPGETRAQAMALIEETVRQACAGDRWFDEHPPVVEWFGWKADPWYQDPEHPYVRSLKATAEAFLGGAVEIQGRSSGNDARFTQYFGRAGVAFGPAAVNIHGPDEYVDLDSVRRTTKVLALHLLDWCGVDQPSRG